MNNSTFTTATAAPVPINAPATASKLMSNGYRPVPCTGKRVLIDAWTTRDFTERDFEASQNVGIKTGDGIALVDIDVTDPTASAAITAEWLRRHHGALQRTGKAPKTAFLVASDIPSKVEVKLPDLGKGDKIEILANGQQFVAYGIHPDTKAPYHWHGLDPLDRILGVKAELPVVSEAALLDFLDWVRVNFGPKEADKSAKEPLSARAAADFKFDTDGKSDFWRNVNNTALVNLGMWVPALFPTAKKSANGAWRITSKDLGRDYQEDLSIHETGISDFGPENTQTAISLTMAFGGAPDPKAAAFWLCDKIGITPETLGWSGGKRARASSDYDAGQPGAAPSNAPDDLDLSQDALANDLGLRCWDSNARHVAAWSKWLFWTGTRWEVDDKLDHLTRIRAYLRERATDVLDGSEHKAAALDAEEEGKGDRLRRRAKDMAQTLRSKNTVVAVESLARSNRASVARSDAFDADRLLLGTPGGTVDLRTGELRPAKREDLITKLTACAPADPGTRPRLWLTFLHDIFDGDGELMAFMQRAAGYALTGLTTEHKLLFLHGTGRNGKSVFLNTLTAIWADYARRGAAETFLNTNGEKHSTGLAGLQGARLVVGSELPVGKTWDESVIKDLTGGDKMTARFMRGDFFDFDPQLTLMIAGNNQPSFRGVDEAIRARVVLVPFAVTIPPEQRDKGLPDKLKNEGPEILRWAIDGALQWLERGLDVPATVAAASAEYMDDEDTLGQFIGDDLQEVRGHFTSATDLHQRFAQWCEVQGLKSWTQLTLIKELKTRGFEPAKSNGRRGLKGLKLN